MVAGEMSVVRCGLGIACVALLLILSVADTASAAYWKGSTYQHGWYKKQTCPPKWRHRKADDTCSRFFPAGNQSLAVKVSFRDAAAYCGSLRAALPVITNYTQLSFYRSFALQSGVGLWMGVTADPAHKRNPQRWIAPNGRSEGILFDWDTRRRMPNGEACVVLHMRGNGETIVGGDNKMITVDCAERHAFVCTRPRLLASLTGVDFLPPSRVEVTWRRARIVRFLGAHIPVGTMVTMQTTNDRVDTKSPNQPTNCKKVSMLTGASTPIRLNVTGRQMAERRLCNGTCDEGVVYFPIGWPWQRGARYSFCFFVPFPFSTPRVASEYALDLLGPRSYLEVVQDRHEYLRDVCNRRKANVNLFYNDRRTDGNTDKAQPYYFESPISGGGSARVP